MTDVNRYATIAPRGRFRRTNKKRGFTLMEVLMVLAILGVIIAMVVPGLMGRQRKANIDATRLSIKGLEQALDMYAVDHNGEYPAGSEGVLNLLSPPSGDAKWAGPYLKNTKSVPTDAWGNPLQYQYPPQNQNEDKPDIWSWGPDKTPSTADDINNWTVTP